MWELQAGSHHPDKFGYHSHCDMKVWTSRATCLKDYVSASENITYLICHVTSGDHMINGSSDFMGERPLW